MTWPLDKKIDAVAFCLAGYAAIALIGGYVTDILTLVDFFVLLFLLVQSVGTVLRNRWAWRGMVAGAGMAAVYGTFGFLSWDVNRTAGLGLALIGAAAMVFFTRSDVRSSLLRQSGSGRCSVLLIDDDRSFAQMIRRRLAKCGLIVEHAETGEMGLRKAREWKPDVILLDVILPGIKGRDVCLQLKADEDVKHIPVIFLTAKDSQDDILAEMQAGAASHLTKPVNIDVLRAHIENVLKHAG